MPSIKKPPLMSSKVTLVITVDDYAEFKDAEFVGYDVRMTRNTIYGDGSTEEAAVGDIGNAISVLSGSIISLLSDPVDHPAVRIQAAIECGHKIVNHVVEESGMQPSNNPEDNSQAQEKPELSEEQQHALDLTLNLSGFKKPIEG